MQLIKRFPPAPLSEKVTTLFRNTIGALIGRICCGLLVELNCRARALDLLFFVIRDVFLCADEGKKAQVEMTQLSEGRVPLCERKLSRFHLKDC